MRVRLARPGRERGTAGSGGQRGWPGGGQGHRLAGEAGRCTPGCPGRSHRLRCLASLAAGGTAASRGWVDGYLSAIDWRPVRGHFTEPGPATVWARLRYPLVPDEEPSPLERVLAIADSGNGVSSELDLRQWLFINPELTVHLPREAAGEWISGLYVQAATSTRWGRPLPRCWRSTSGQIGVGAQALLVMKSCPRPRAGMSARPGHASPCRPAAAPDIRAREPGCA